MLQYLLHAFNVYMCTSLDTVLLFEEEKHVLFRVTIKMYTLYCSFFTFSLTNSRR